MYKMKFLTCVFVVILFLGQSMNVYAKEATPIRINGEIFTWTETMDMQIEKSDNKEVHITGTDLQTEETYNYVTVSSMFAGAYEKSVYHKGYAGITMEIENVGDTPIFLSFSLLDQNNNQLVMHENTYIIKEFDGKSFPKKVENSTFEIEPGFNGKVTIPLSMMIESENNEKKFNYSQLAFWSIGMLVGGNETVDFYIRSLSWQEQDYLQQYENSLGVCIEGEEIVQIPEHGESISFFKITSDGDHTYQFVTDGLPQGVSIDKMGKLVLDTTVEEQTVTIKAIDDLGMIIYKDVVLQYSWRKDNEKITFYAPDELSKIEYPFDDVKESHIVVLRRVLLGGCIIVFMSYVVFYTIYQLKKKKEEE